jgi:hypothetical protein
MPRFRVFALFVVLAVAGSTGASGQAAGAFARMGFAARGMAMSNALAADASGDASPFYNPALAPFTERQNLVLSAALLRFDRELQYLQFSAPLRPRAGIAVGLIHAGVNDIDGRDGSGFHTGTLSTDEFDIFMAFGVHLSERVTGGIALQLFRADLYDDLEAINSIGVDFGLSVRVTDALSLGLVADDLLARYSWDTSGLYGEGGKSTSDRFPARIRFGGAYTILDGRGLIVAEYESRFTSSEYRTRRVELIGDVPREVTDTERLRLHDSRFRLGGEYHLADVFAVRAGADQFGGGGFTSVHVTACTPPKTV